MSAPARDHTNEIRRLTTLLEISQALSGILNLKSALHSVIAILQRRHEVTGGSVLLVEEQTHELQPKQLSACVKPGAAPAAGPSMALRRA